MSRGRFWECVEGMVREGRLTRDQAEDLYRRQQAETQRFVLDQQHSPESAARLAAESALESAGRDLRLQRYQASLQAIRNAENARRIMDYQHGPTLGLRALLARDSHGLAQFPNVEIHAREILGQAHAIMAEHLSKARTRWFGLHRNKKLMNHVVDEVFGSSTGDAGAAGFARAWAQAAEQMRLRFNRAGGAIPRRADWGMPQSHDPVLVGRASRSEWVDFIKDKLDLEKMIDIETGQPFTPDALEVVLQGIYETIRTNGLVDMAPGARAGTKLANRRQEARFLTFKDPEAWRAYQERFGSGNHFATMMDHLRGMARDISLLETLGPNPAAGYRMLTDLARRAEDRPVSRQANDAIFRLVNGSGDTNRSPHLAHFMGAIRNWNVASKLGAAALSAVSDVWFMASTSLWNGVSAIGTWRNYLRQLNPLNEADRILATRIGITALSWAEAYSNAARFTEVGAVGSSALGKFSHAGAMTGEVVLRATGLNAMTDAGRRAFAMEFSANLAERFGRSFDQLDGTFGRRLREAGMTAAEWDVLRQTPTLEHNGARFFVVDHLMGREDLPLSQRQALATRIQGIINEEVLFAVPEPDSLARVWTTGGGQQRGTPLGEGARTVMQFKSFPIAVLSSHARRAWHARELRGGLWAGAYAAHVIIGTTVLGMVAMQAKRIARGQDPRDMDDPGAWAAAFAQGGGAGIYGDFLFQDVNRFGKGLVATMAGPSADLVDDMAKLTLGNVQQLLQGEDLDLAKDVVGFARRYTPGGSIWYARLVLEREVFDQLELWADPQAARARFIRSERRLRQEGSGYWWRPGKRLPDRAPDFGLEGFE